MNRQKAWKRAAAAMLAVTTIAGNLLAPAQLKLGTLSETAITAEASTITKKNFTFDSKTGTLTITGTINDEYDPDKMISELLTIYNQNSTGGIWPSTISKDSVKHIVFASTAKLPRSCRQMFEGYTSLEDVVFEEGCDISNVFKFSAMFKDCTSLTKFDMNGATGANGIKYTADMFEGCTALKEVYMTSVTGEVICNGTWDEHTALDHIRQMVESCSSLKTLELSNSFVYYAIENVKKNDGDTSLDEILDTILENCDSPYVDDIRAALEAQYWAYVHALEDGQQFKAIDWQWSEYSEADGFTCLVTIQKLYPEVETHVVSADVTVYTTPATCLNGGSELYSASWKNASGTDFYCTETRTHDLAPLGHTEAEAVEENRVEPTCTEAGHYDSVVYCSVCGAELNRETVEIPAAGHTAGEAVEENRVEPTCAEAGHYDSVIYCSVCGAELNRETIEIPATDEHTAGAAVEENRVEPTCTEAGHYDSVIYCSDCGKELSRETIEIPAAGHTEAEAVEENRVEPTCTEAGHYDSVVYCSVCGAELSRETVEIPAAGHTPAEAVEENRVEATAVTDGHYDSVVYCSVCGAELSRETITIPATGCTAVLQVAKVAFGSYIGLIYEVQLSDDILSDEGAYITFEQNGKTTTALVSSFKIDEASKVAKFRFNTVAKEYADTVTFKMFNSNDRAVKLVSTAGTDYTENGFQYSVKNYVDYMAVYGTAEQMRQVADALSTYCQATQIYFEYNADDLDISEKVDGIGADQLNKYVLSSVGKTPAGITSKELTTVYVEANNLKVKYIVSEDADEESLSFQIDSKDAETTVEMLKNDDGTESKALVLTVKNILPEDFDQTHTFTVTNGTDTNVITASALSYAQLLFNDKSDDAKNLARATYLYYEAAKAYDQMLNN